MLEVNNFYFQYNNRFLFDNTCFTSKCGDFTVIMGESGCGKTTFLNSLQKKNSFTGNYTIDSKEPNIDDIYYIPQVPEFIDDIKVRYHFEIFNADITDNELLEKLQIDTLLDKYPNELSGGEKKRVAIALAIYTDSKILILDEPASALDPSFIHIAGDILKSYAKAGHYVIASSHDEILKEYADKVYLIDYMKFNIVKDNDSEEISYTQKDIHTNFKVKHIMDFIIHSFKRQKVVQILMVLLIAGISVAPVYNNYSLNRSTELMNELSSNEILVFRNIDKDNQADYSYSGSEYPIDEDTVEQMKELDNIDTVDYRYDMDMAWGITELLGTNDNDGTLSNLKKIYGTVNGKKIYIKDADNYAEEAFVEHSFNEETVNKDKIETKLSEQQGVYISKAFAEIIFGDVKEDDQLTLYFPLYVPLANMDGVTSVQVNENSDEVLANCVGTKLVWIELPVEGILNSSTMYANDATNYIYNLYVSQDILENYIEKYKPDHYPTIYVTKNNGACYDETPPSDYVVTATIITSEWKPDCYVVRVKDITKLEDTLNDINSLGLDAKCVYINASSLRKSLSSTKKTLNIVSGALLVMLLVMSILLSVKDHSLAQLKVFLKKTGSKILFRISSVRLIDTVFKTIAAVIASEILVYGLNHLKSGYTSFTVKNAILEAAIAVVTCFIIPVIVQMLPQKERK